jgi:phage terminase small subunit
MAEKTRRALVYKRNGRAHRRDQIRQRMFAEAYLDISNPETYLKCGPSARKAGYSESYAKGRSHELLGRVGIQSEFKRLRYQRLKHSTIATPEEILETLTTQIRTLPNELMDDKGTLIPLNQLDRDKAQAIAGLKFKRRTYVQDDEPVTEDTIEYKLVDRQKAAEMLGKHHGIFEKDNRQKAEAGSVRLVAYPLGELTLEEWQSQVMVIMASVHQAQPCQALPGPKPAGESTVG